MHNNIEPLLNNFHGYLDEPNQQLVNEYIYARYLIELLERCNPTEITLHTARQYGITYLTPWKDDCYLIEEFYQNNREELTLFNIRNMIKKLCELRNISWKIYTNNQSRKIPLDQSTIMTIRNVINTIRGVEGSNNYHTIKDTIDIARRTMSYFQIDKQLSPHLQMLASVLKGYWATFMTLNKDNDNEHAKHHHGPDRFEILDDKIYNWIQCDLNDLFLGIKENTLDIYPTALNLYTIFIYLIQPDKIHLNTLDRLYEKYITQDNQYSTLVSKVRQYSGVFPNDAIGTDKLDFCSCIQKKLAMDVGSSEMNIDPDSAVERYLILNQIVHC